MHTIWKKGKGLYVGAVTKRQELPKLRKNMLLSVVLSVTLRFAATKNRQDRCKMQKSCLFDRCGEFYAPVARERSSQMEAISSAG